MARHNQPRLVGNNLVEGGDSSRALLLGRCIGGPNTHSRENQHAAEQGPRAMDQSISLHILSVPRSLRRIRGKQELRFSVAVSPAHGGLHAVILISAIREVFSMTTQFLITSTLLAWVLTVTAVNAQTVDSATKQDATNTKANAADRNTDAKTPLGQSNDKESIDVTAGIRRAVLEDKSLSTSAHNIKIVTNGDVVTLRGPVESADEKKRVESLAVKVATGKQVRNEISVAR
jgi:hyperosmotically inducible periplasmic protein